MEWEFHLFKMEYVEFFGSSFQSVVWSTFLRIPEIDIQAQESFGNAKNQIMRQSGERTTNVISTRYSISPDLALDL